LNLLSKIKSKIQPKQAVPEPEKLDVAGGVPDISDLVAPDGGLCRRRPSAYGGEVRKGISRHRIASRNLCHMVGRRLQDRRHRY